MLAIMIYYSQPSIFARALSTDTNLSSEASAFKDQLPRPDTEVRQARMRFQLIIDKTRLIVYASLCGVALAASVAGLVLSVCVSGIPETTAFPGWDERAKCRIPGEDEEGISGADTGKVVALAERLRVSFVE
jgi:hypothetical protein